MNGFKLQETGPANIVVQIYSEHHNSLIAMLDLTGPFSESNYAPVQAKRGYNFPPAKKSYTYKEDPSLLLHDGV